MPNVKAQKGDKVQYANNQYDALQNTSALIIATEWSEFRMPDFERMKNTLEFKIVFDGRNIFETCLMKKLKFDYLVLADN